MYTDDACVIGFNIFDNIITKSISDVSISDDNVNIDEKDIDMKFTLPTNHTMSSIDIKDIQPEVLCDRCVCGNLSTTWCVCYKIKYCSMECWRTNWAIHQIECIDKQHVPITLDFNDIKAYIILCWQSVLQGLAMLPFSKEREIYTFYTTAPTGQVLYLVFIRHIRYPRAIFVNSVKRAHTVLMLSPDFLVAGQDDTDNFYLDCIKVRLTLFSCIDFYTGTIYIDPMSSIPYSSTSHLVTASPSTFSSTYPFTPTFNDTHTPLFVHS